MPKGVAVVVSLRRVAISLLSAVALTLGLTLAVATPASASWGGQITNVGSTTFSVCKNAASWTRCASGVASLRPGQSTHRTLGWKDADMFYVGSRCTAYVGTTKMGVHGGWVKIRDWSRVSVRMACW